MTLWVQDRGQLNLNDFPRTEKDEFCVSHLFGVYFHRNPIYVIINGILSSVFVMTVLDYSRRTNQIFIKLIFLVSAIIQNSKYNNRYIIKSIVYPMSDDIRTCTKSIDLIF